MLIEQTLIVKSVSNKVIIRYECEGEVFGFILSRDAALELAGILEAAARTEKGYSVSINI